MKKEDVIFERKEFLNLPGHNGMANVVTNIISEKGWRDDVNDEGKPLYRHIDCKLDFADCNRMVSMEMGSYETEYGRDNMMHKVNTLIDVLTEFRDALEKELKYQDRLEKRRNRHEAEKESNETK
jgi:hypothetical protein